ncbi:MAG: hypothetical protein ABFR82_05935 [Nitrospirota bacterium]
MQFPKTHRELKEVFTTAAAPEIVDLNGEYLVDMLTVFPSFKRFSHRKVIYQDNDKVKGHNILFGKKWGYFLIDESICRMVDSVNVAVINYNRPENMLPIRGIRDQLRCVDKGNLYIGRFNYLLAGKLYFLGYFSLEKIMQERGCPAPAK